ncbi:sulfotransferase 1B1-like [Mytilus californianus]|uniref:sulfotransferase 1B1-like n=1 Tax=Mytilus californianus TaxID=6549 RepID=UPI002246DE45|nr:sulfotransferase 1B1-like [Mytilus californianus]
MATSNVNESCHQKQTRKPIAVYPFHRYGKITILSTPAIQQDAAKVIQSTKNLNSRETDVILCSSMKSGTHWTHEIISMLLHQTTEYNTFGVLAKFNFESQTDWEGLEEEDNPRLFHTHLPLSYLPKKHIENRNKIIYLNRNPKDRAVSLYFFLQGKQGVPVWTWSEFFENFILKDDLYGGWFNFTQEFEKAVENKTANVLSVTYEDLKLIPIQTMKKIASFLNVNISEELIKDIFDKCAFDNLKDHKLDGSRDIDPEGNSTLWRKGIIGDWKNWFTVSQSEQFDQLYNKEMKECNVKFIYDD